MHVLSDPLASDSDLDASGGQPSGSDNEGKDEDDSLHDSRDQRDPTIDYGSDTQQDDF